MKSPQQTPKIAIITRTKNRNLLLRRVVESVKAQTYREYVHVILNDGGDREELEALLGEISDIQRVVIHNETSVGLTRALNQAIRAVESEYITILDDDDTWPSDRLEKVMDFFDKNPNTAAAVVKMDIIIEDIQDGEIIKRDQHLHPDSGDGEINLFKQCMRNYISNGVVTYRRSVYEELNGYDESLATAEDWDFGLRLLLKYDVESIQSDTPLFFYHQRPQLVDDNGNSVHAGVREQEVTVNKLRNKYLRDDLNNNKLGVGYIMNQMVFDISNVVRIESHTNYLADGAKQQLGQLDMTIRELIGSTFGYRLGVKIAKILNR
jgi:glycosyltransferase involved in cell wall biosynthesis